MLTSIFNQLFIHPGEREDQFVLDFVFTPTTMLQKQQVAITKTKAPLSSTSCLQVTSKTTDARATSKECQEAKKTLLMGYLGPTLFNSQPFLQQVWVTGLCH
jgi:hypothetical protein